ncbi:hypothetical protein [Ruegeria arenilitoris]|uniref:hypothetical protein n=1 Tax=Ruegeria arenilitoris TaxID=1173585 RepID=UPI003C7B4A7B
MIIMPTKKKPATSYLPPELHAQLRAVAEAEGHAFSTFVGKMIELVVEDEKPEPAHQCEGGKGRKEGKITVRVARDVRSKIEREAKIQGIPPSTWAARILTARVLAAPQPI